MTAGIVVVVGGTVVVGAIVVVVVGGTVVEVVVDSTTGTDEKSVAPCAESEAHAEAVSNSASEPRATVARRKLGIPSKYPLRRTKCWRSQFMTDVAPKQKKMEDRASNTVAITWLGETIHRYAYSDNYQTTLM